MKNQTLRYSLIAVLAGLTLGATSVRAHDAKHHHDDTKLDTQRPSPVSGESIYNLPSTWTNQDGQTAKLSSLKGRPVVVAMVYTSCMGACPMTIADLKKIEAKLSDSARAECSFAIFSFDSERDTPAKLAEFAKKHQLDLKRWTLYNGKPGDVRELAALLGIQYKKNKVGDYDHSNVITALDSEGLIRSQQVGLGKDPKEFAATMEKLTTKK